MSKSAEKDRNVRKKKTFTDYWEKYSTVAILVLMVVVFGILEPQAFMTGSNFIKIIEQSSITILLACGEFLQFCLQELICLSDQYLRYPEWLRQNLW